jgi:phage gpG-like protein
MARDLLQFTADIRRRSAQLSRYIATDLPRHVAHMGKKHFGESFTNQGFTDETLKPWPEVWRRKPGSKAKGVAASRTILHGETSELRNSIEARPSRDRVVFSSDVPYARAHNQGFVGGVSVRPHGRRTKNSGSASNIRSRKSFASNKAHVRGFTRRVKLPKRQFMGHSATLDRAIIHRAQSDITKIMQL